MRCPQCQSEHPSGAKFCADCGARLPRRCPRCGTEVAVTAKFCAECGTTLATAPPPGSPVPDGAPPLDLAAQFSVLERALPPAVREQIVTPEEGENRVLTILFADLTGSTGATAGLRPEAAAVLVNDVLKAMMDAILRYEGRINRLLGDEVLAFFGTPVAHENDPERAILAALALRDAVQGLGLNVYVGINTGDVYLGAIGAERHHEFTAIGSPINLAARLRAQAAPGQILVGEPVYRQTRRAFTFAPHTFDLKGVPYPVTAFEVVGVLPHPEKGRGIEGLHASLIGRERELTTLIECADALVAERQGQIVTIVGEAGIGKTRLMTELKAHLGEKEIPWMEGRCVEIGQPVSFWPFIDLIRTHLGVTSEDSDEEVATRLVDRLTTLFGSDAEGIIPYVGHMLSVKMAEPYAERLRHAAPEQIHRQTLLRLRDVVVALARRQPLVLILEDLHWADDASLEMVWVLLDELVSAPFLLVCAFRPEHEHGCWTIEGAARSKYPEQHTSLPLKPLTRRQSHALVESLLAIPELPESTRTSILETAEGNPFFVEEVVRLLIEQGVIYRQDGGWQAREAGAEVVVPDTIESVLLSRIDRLQSEVKHVLQCASVIGRVFQRRLLEYVSGQSDALEQCLAHLEEHELVYKERMVPEVEYSFKHALTQVTAYEGLLTPQRHVFHERIGTGIEALYEGQLDEYYEVLAYHYSHSANTTKAVDYLIKAGDKAAGRYANEQALAYYGQALALGGDIQAQEVILARRASALVDTYRGRAALEDYGRLLVGARERGDQHSELEALLGLGDAYYVVALDETEGDGASNCRSMAEKAYALAAHLGDKRGMVRALVRTRWLSDFWPEYREQGLANLREAVALSEAVGDEDLILDSRLGLWRFLDTSEFGPWGDELRRQIEARHDLRRLNELYFGFAFWYLNVGRFEHAVACCEDAIRLAGEMGMAPVQYPTIKALALLRLGRYGEAWEAFQQEVADDEHPFGRAMQGLGMGLYYLDLMAYERAAALLRAVSLEARRLQRPWMTRWAAECLALAVTHGGSSIADTADDAAPARVGPSAEQEVFPAAVLAELLLAQGHLEEGLRQAEVGVAEAGENGLERATVLEIKLRILLRLGRPAAALPLAAEVLSLAEEMGYLPLIWRVQAARAEALAALGDADGASHAREAAAEVIHTLAESIADATVRQDFLTADRVAAVLRAVSE